jgi:hypothetical protein
MTSSRCLNLLTSACSTNTTTTTTTNNELLPTTSIINSFNQELNRLRDVEPLSIEQLRKNKIEVEQNLLPASKGLAQTKLDLGTALALSRERIDNVEACQILDEVQRESAFASLLFESLFWMACARLHLGEFREARILCERLLRRDPESIVAKTLLNVIRSKVRSDGMKGLVVVVLVASVAAIAGHLFGSMRRNS